MVLHIKLQSESEMSDFSDSNESVLGVQMELTASCQDTPDTESSSLESEFSLASSSSSSPTLPEVSSPDDTHEFPEPELHQSITVNPKKCIKCHLYNKTSPFLFCRQCYMDRKRFLPPRPKMKSKQSSSDRNRSVTGKAIRLQYSPPSSDHFESQPSACGCCNDAPCDGIFVHGDIGHQIFCYRCAHRVWLERKSCPYCNRTISKVVKLFRVV